MSDQARLWLTFSVKVGGVGLPSELMLKVSLKPRENKPSVKFMIEIITERSGGLPATVRSAVYQTSSHLL